MGHGLLPIVDLTDSPRKKPARAEAPIVIVDDDEDGVLVSRTPPPRRLKRKRHSANVLDMLQDNNTTEDEKMTKPKKLRSRVSAPTAVPPRRRRLVFDSDSSSLSQLPRSRSPSPPPSPLTDPDTPPRRITTAERLAVLKERRAARARSPPRRVARPLHVPGGHFRTPGHGTSTSSLTSTVVAPQCSLSSPTPVPAGSSAFKPVSQATALPSMDLESVKRLIRSDHTLVERLTVLADEGDTSTLQVLRALYPRCVYCRGHFRVALRCVQPHRVDSWTVTGRMATGNCRRCNVRMEAEVDASGKPRRDEFGTCYDGVHTSNSRSLTAIRIQRAQQLVADTPL